MKVSKKYYQRVMKALHRNRLPEGMPLDGFRNGYHEKQHEIIRGMLDPNITTVFAAMGRKASKTDTALYVLNRQALLYPKSACYYICPTRKDGKDIIWDVRRLQDFLGEDADYFIERIDNRDLTVFYKNGSFIQIRGAERYENANGLSPDILVYDEFKAFHKEFHRTMSMNKAAKGAKLLIIGTKADYMANNKAEYWAKYKGAKNSKQQLLVEATTFDNPMNNRPAIKALIMEDIQDLRDQGREEVVQREYYNKIIPGGSNAIFPEFNPRVHVKPHKEVMEEVNKQFNEGQFYQVIDPATSSTFGGLFIFHNPYTGRVYMLDEIYEQELKNVGITKVFPKIRQIAAELTGSNDFAGLWYPVYDEAALWAANEIMDNYQIAYIATNKNAMSQEGGISIIKYLLGKELITISDRCVNLTEEILGYKRDGNGQIRKGLCEDHVIDCIAEGEIISTIRGDVKIEDIKVGDKVYTNKGIDIVTDHWSKGESDVIKLHFSNGSTLKTTKNHLVFTKNRGFIQSSLLTQFDTFDTVSLWKKLKLRIKALFSDVIRIVKTNLIGIIIDPAQAIIKRVLDTFTDINMNVKLGLFQKECKYITKIITLTTMKLVTWSRSLSKITKQNTQAIAQTLCELISIILDTLRKLGTRPRRAVDGMVRTLRDSGLICPWWIKFVSFATKNIKSKSLWVKSLSSVPTTVRLLRIEELGKERVYDLTTKHYNRFYANGVNVHNCTRYFIQAANYTVNLEVRDLRDAPRADLYYTKGLEEVLNEDSIFNLDMDVDIEVNLDDF